LRTIGILLCLLTATTLGACGGGSSSSSTSSTATGAAAATAPAASGATTTAKSGAPAAAGAHASGSPGSGTAAQTQFKQALSTFAACLKSGGVKLPGAKGGQALSLKGVDTKSAEYRSALAKCRPVLAAALKSVSKTRSTPATPAGPATAVRTTPAPKVKLPPALAAGLKGFTACMRGHGISAFPEPTGASFNLTGTGVDASSAQYKVAQSACNPLLQKAFSQR